MSEQTAKKPRYTVSIHESQDPCGTLVFIFVPGEIHPVPQFIVSVRRDGDKLAFDWSGTRNDPGDCRQEIEADVAARMNDRSTWITRITTLVDQVEQWARAMGWSTRRVEKRLEDMRIGKHRVPALLMQEDTCRILLEPVGRSAPGTEGVVDLYLMPAYDDIASLYYYDNQWNLHYAFPGTKTAATVREAASLPLSQESLKTVLSEMGKHAA